MIRPPAHEHSASPPPCSSSANSSRGDTAGFLDDNALSAQVLATQMLSRSSFHGVGTSLFIGSSSEGIDVARALQLELDKDAEVEIWSQGQFELSEGTLASLVAATDRFDFAVLVLTADDMTVSRGVEEPAARDNVLFELGLFMGGLGANRTFIVYDRSNPPRLPSDLAGVTTAKYRPHDSGNLRASLGASATQIRTRMSNLGPRLDRAGQALENATNSLDSATLRAAQIAHLMARSRITELEITIKTFGPMLGNDMVDRIRQDIKELQRLSSDAGEDASDAASLERND